MNDLDWLVAKKKAAMKNAIEQGFPVIPEDLDIEQLQKARIELKEEGISVEVYEINVGFLLEHYCMCRINNFDPPHDLKHMLKLEKCMADRGSAVIHFFNNETRKIQQCIVEFDVIKSIISSDLSKCPDLPWDLYNDEAAWKVGSLVIDVLLSRKKEQEKAILSDAFPQIS